MDSPAGARSAGIGSGEERASQSGAKGTLRHSGGRMMSTARGARGRTRQPIRVAVAGAAVFGSFCFVVAVGGFPAPAATAGPAQAHIYWSNQNGSAGDTIGRADIDGTGVDPSFITGANGPGGLALDDTHIYWTNTGSGPTFGCGTTIGRANRDGTGVNQSFITAAGSPNSIAVDGAHLYWTNVGCPLGSGTTIGRANIDGTGVDASFITGASSPLGIAVDQAHIYWANVGAAPGTSNSIGRANLDGTGVDQNFISTATGPGGVAVDCTHIYWANFGPFIGSTIGRANLDGTGAEQSFITGASGPTGVAVEKPKRCTTKGKSKRSTAQVLGRRLTALPATGTSSVSLIAPGVVFLAGGALTRRASRSRS